MRSLSTTGLIWWVLAFAAIGLLACGSSEPDPSGPPHSDAEIEDRMANLYSWPSTGGAERDLSADNRQCLERVYGDNPDLKDSPSLAAVGQHVQCMKALGWHTQN